MSLIILAFVIIACFWLAQMLLYYLTSKPMNAYMISNIGRELIRDYEGYPSSEFKEKLESSANKNGIQITFFSANLDRENEEVFQTYVIYSVSAFANDVLSFGQPLVWNEEQHSAFFNEHIFSDESEFTYMVNSPPSLIYGAQFVDSEYDMTIFAYIEAYPAASSIDFSTTLIQLFIASLVCIVLAVLIALVYSRQFSGPIVEFAEAAESLAKGKYDSIKFKRRGIKEIDSLADSLRYAAEEIKKTDEFRREFLANITHDLRTPITMMRGYAEMIRDISGENKEKRTSHAQIIIDESERLSLLVEDILLMSKLDAGTLKLNKTEFDISTLAATVIERFKIKTIKEGYKFHIEYGKNNLVNADMQRIEQVLYNLIANAVNYAGERKGIFVKIYRVPSGACRVEVRDTGKGIPQNELELIWERYYRVNQLTRKVIGSGIGLNIVKGILESHGAVFGVESTLNEGTSFWFEL